MKTKFNQGYLKIGFFAILLLFIAATGCEKDTSSVLAPTDNINYQKSSITSLDKLTSSITTHCTVQSVCEFASDMDYGTGGEIAAEKVLIGCPNNVDGCVYNFATQIANNGKRHTFIIDNMDETLFDDGDGVDDVSYYNDQMLYSKEYPIDPLNPPIPPTMTAEELNCYLGRLKNVVNKLLVDEANESPNFVAPFSIKIVPQTITKSTTGKIIYYHQLIVEFRPYATRICP